MNTYTEPVHSGKKEPPSSHWAKTLKKKKSGKNSLICKAALLHGFLAKDVPKAFPYQFFTVFEVLKCG